MFWKRKRTPYVDFLPDPADATINLLKQFLKKRKSVAEFKIGVSHLESPSSRLAVELYQLITYGQKHLVVEVGIIQEPDPRVPHQPVDFVLWRYDGTDPIPALPTPTPEVARQVANLAATPYNLTRWIEQAKQLASQLGIQSVPDLLRTMVHPTPPPAKVAVWNWIYQMQVAAAYTIAFIDDGWEGSRRKSTLTSLAYGPMDWTVGAAVLALQQIAIAESSSRVDIGVIYVNLLEAMPSDGDVPNFGERISCLANLLPLLSGPSGRSIAGRAVAALQRQGYHPAGKTRRKLVTRMDLLGTNAHQSIIHAAMFPQLM